MNEPVLLGIDSGGSHTRAICVDLDGRFRGGAQTGGGSPTHNSDARDHVRDAIEGALESAGAAAGDVIGLGAGMAGFEADSDRAWAEDFVGVDGLVCPRFLVNDAVVAHIGAFAGGPGVMVVAGTGSMILAITESGERIQNDRYRHYAGGARHLSFNALARILTDDDTDADAQFVGAVLDYWNVSDKPGLRRRVAEMHLLDRNEVKRLYGGMTPLITAAVGHSPLASDACRWLVAATCVGVRLLAPDIGSEPVGVALEGGLATCAAFTALMNTELAAVTSRIRVVPSILSPVAGAAFMAMQQTGNTPDEAVIERLATSVRPAFEIPAA